MPTMIDCFCSKSDKNKVPITLSTVYQRCSFTRCMIERSIIAGRGRLTSTELRIAGNDEEFHAKCNFPSQLGSIVIFITGLKGSRPTLIRFDAYD